ncbi:MAG: hypothetical protein AVDCRST_MAG77-4413 [uncultured Chloroflexi bacterium]|uniref:Uncharacterized protein n=1 Tax=uncultured Chloroflexota bacterium TaxID=166587 RepID=A0A6J4JTW3_9CHLR|nr:MAG: hypothetical protein AVDCRST_MAG77-4413 [uncultured Chloroflexota bacterium]
MISALLAGDEARWAALLVPEEAGGVPAALRGYLREYQRLMPGCRGVPVEHAARAVSGGHDGAFFEARFASACVARESQPCDTIGFGMRRIGERWYVATIDRGACDVDLQPAA